MRRYKKIFNVLETTHPALVVPQSISVKGVIYIPCVSFWSENGVLSETHYKSEQNKTCFSVRMNNEHGFIVGCTDIYLLDKKKIDIYD